MVFLQAPSNLSPEFNTMEKTDFNSDIPPSEWLAVGLLDGTWAGGKVMVTVDVISPIPKIHLVHLFAEKISKQNGFALIDTCFAYCPELDFFIPFASSVAAARSIELLYQDNKVSIATKAIDMINAKNN